MIGFERLLPVLAAAEMRAWEARVFAPGAGMSEAVVMEAAGRAVALATSRYMAPGLAVAAVGGGNNGGDAIVALRTLKAWGWEVGAVHTGEAGKHRELAHGWEIPRVEPSLFHAADVIIDGLLGTGGAGAPRGPTAEIIQQVNQALPPVIAVDGPSGVDLTTGAAAGPAIFASLTVTFGALKRGLLLHPGRSHAGHLLLAEVGFPPLALSEHTASLLTDAWARTSLPLVEPDAHKGSNGMVAVVAGRQGVAGAAIMAAMGALRAGSGGVRIVSSEANRSAIQSAVPEAVFVDRQSGDLEAQLSRVTAAVVGPGIGTDESARALLDRVAALGVPMVLDADALTLLASRASLEGEMSGRSVLTPHPGELARLLGTTIQEVLQDRLAAAEQAADRFGAVVLAKGAPSVVAAPGRALLIGASGHSGVATGGMGDTLAGVVGAMLGMGSEPRIAAALGLHFAGRAAEVAGRGRGLLPRDVAEALPEAIGGAVLEAPAPPFLFELPPPT